MKKLISLHSSLLLLAQVVLADIPVDENGNNLDQYYSGTNYWPWILGALGALGILIFMYVYKKETHGKK